MVTTASPPRKRKAKVTPTAKAIHDRTVKWGGNYGIYSEDSGGKKGLSKKAKKVVKALDKMDLGCRDQGVRELMSVMLDERIPKKKGSDSRGVEFLVGTVVIPKSRAALDGNSDVGVPYIMVDSKGSAVSVVEGERVRTSFSKKCVDYVELPSVAEISLLLEELKKDAGDDWVDLVLRLLSE